MEQVSWITIAFIVADWILRIGLSVRIVMRPRAVGVSLSWLVVVLLLPFAGAVIYLLVGEISLGAKRARRAAEIHELHRKRLAALSDTAPVDWSALNPMCRQLNQHAASAVGAPALGGNRLELIQDWEQTLRSLVADIDRARRACHLEFYIWSAGGAADEVAEALIRAARRGVTCRVLLDAVGSARFLRGALAARLRESGVRLVAALPVGLFRMLFVRLDLRIHRKLVIIDGETAYIGSQNLADARHFKRESGVGPYVDAMVRAQGPAVEALDVIFSEDWELETGEGLAERRNGERSPTPERPGGSVVQAVPTGPGPAPDTIHEMLLATVYAARRELVMTTPYFVPDESLLTALTSAAKRGVDVVIIVPAKIDFPLVWLASRSHFDELLAAGVRVMRFRPGLLHAKTITVDGEIGLVGSVNMDMRSFWLNLEITLFIYDPTFSAQLREAQQGYLAQSEALELTAWRARPAFHRFAENAAQLLGPLL